MLDRNKSTVSSKKLIKMCRISSSDPSFENASEPIMANIVVVIRTYDTEPQNNTLESSFRSPFLLR